MGRAPCCSKVGLHRGPWTPREDTLLTMYIQAHGEGHWRSLPKKAGLLRCGKSCRLRWMNYLRPDIKRGNITPDEDDLIIRMHALLGNRWSLIAGRLPGRTDNEIKNYWNTHLSKKLRSQGTDPNTHKKLSEPIQQVKRKRIKNSNTSTNKKQHKSRKILPKIKSEKSPKVHQPKAVKLTSLSLPRNDSFDCNSGSNLSCSQEGEAIGLIGSEILIDLPNWCTSNNDDNHSNGVSFLVRDSNHDIVSGSDVSECQSLIPNSECQSLIPNSECQSLLVSTTNNNNNNNLDTLYEEYLQLLKTDEDQLELDSFAESLLL